MRPNLEEQIERARERAKSMTESEREAQRRSFVFGNVKIENDAVTRIMVDEVAEELAAAKKSP